MKSASSLRFLLLFCVLIWRMNEIYLVSKRGYYDCAREKIAPEIISSENKAKFNTMLFLSTISP